MPQSLKNQVVLVVGASSGIGRETAVLFAAEGARVVASARREDRLRELQKTLAGQGQSIEVFPADVSDPDQMENLNAYAEKVFGPVDILVYASGTNTQQRALGKLTPPVWNELITVNLNGAYYATAALLPQMRQRKAGHLIYVSSISGLVPDVSGAAYQASKRGVLGLAHAVRVEEKEHGIRTCAVCPGLVETEILEKRPVKPDAATLAKALQPVDVAEAILAIAKLPARASVPELQLMPTQL
jgi:NADP-dependent 3-hydroxy acid dehydrogenase YdfG